MNGLMKRFEQQVQLSSSPVAPSGGNTALGGAPLSWLCRLRLAWRALTSGPKSLQELLDSRTASELVCLHQSLTKAKLDSEAANRAKTAFLASMSHELRTPLAALSGFAELLSDEHLSIHERREYSRSILRNAQQLQRIIDDILDLTKVEAGKLEIKIEAHAVSDLLLEVVQNFQPMVDAKGISLQTTIDPACLGKIHTDATRLNQILTNIIGNAIKFTDRGGIVISMHPAGDRHPGLWSIAVQDSGPGISLQDQEKLFRTFSQVRTHGMRCRTGSGLGLVLARNLARLLGGDVYLQSSRPGQGSTFVVLLDPEARTKEANSPYGDQTGFLNPSSPASSLSNSTAH